MTAPRPLTMADLTPGTRVRHAGWGDTGTIRQCGEVTEFRSDEHFGDIEVSLEGPVFPADLEILRPAAKPLSADEVSARRWRVPYRLYKDQTACDSDDWGPPVSMHQDLFDAMWAAAANGVPLSCWKTDPHCPDEVFTETTPQWSILGPGAAAEAEAMRVSPPWGGRQ